MYRIGWWAYYGSVLADTWRISYEGIPAEALDLVQKTDSSLNINHTGFDVAICNGNMHLLNLMLCLEIKGFEVLIFTNFHSKSSWITKNPP
ncbi:hypothetical protein ABEY69_01940 [Priestia filamentosa]|uniref:hypothetical protein n=1 Tax=Priestia filamentosa TaxID=1402861 RepID=UPI003D2A1FF5